MKRRALGTLLLLSSFFFIFACKSKTVSEGEKKFTVALVLDKGGVDDKSFNSSAHLGAKRAREELGVEIREVETTDDAQVEPTLKTFARKNVDLIIGIGFSQQEAMKRAAEANPQSKFAIVDAVVELPNVSSLMFREHEGSYLVGALSALKSKSGVIGFIGGMDIPLIRRFELGYLEGAKKANPKIRIISNYVGTSGDAWNNPTKGKELALSQIQQGADVIYHAAGASGLGLFDAVEEKAGSDKESPKVLAVGVDSNQNFVKPGLILTSMLKRVDVAVFDTIKAAKEGKLIAGRKDFGLQDGGIDLAMDENNKNLISENLLKEIDLLRNEIKLSKVTVSDYYKIKK